MTRPAPPSLYDDDFYAWTQAQAAALRRISASAVGDVDIEHLAEEIEDLGKRDLREVTSFLRRLFEHLIKIKACPESRDVPHWRAEALQFHVSVLDAYTPGMRQLIKLESLWRSGAKLAQERLGDAASIQADCPFNLDDLVVEDFDLDAALGRIAADP